MVLAVIVGIGSNFFTEFTTSMQGQDVDLAAAMSLALGALTLFGLGIFGPGIASGLVAGAPQLGAGAALGTVAGAAGVTMLAGGAAVGAAGAVGGAALGAVRAGTNMGSAASTAYTLGKETAASPTMSAGLGGVARAAGNAARMRMSSALGLGDAARSGRQAAWNALNETSSPASDGAGAATTPAWAQSLRAAQAARHHQQIAVHALQQGDRGGASATPDIKERDE
jgi:type IV secretion system protein TrbL